MANNEPYGLSRLTHWTKLDAMRLVLVDNLQGGLVIGG